MSSVSRSWKYRNYPAIAGPNDFAEAVVEWRTWLREREFMSEFTGAISDAGLRELLTLTYFASLLPEEGRLPAIQLHVPYPTKHSTLGFMQFSPPRKLSTADDLRKLAPVADAPHSTLEVAESEDGLVVTGIGSRSVPTDAHVWSPTAISEDADKVSGGLDIFIDGPGELRVAEGLSAFRVRGNRIAQLTDFLGVSSIAEWLRECATGVCTKNGLVAPATPATAECLLGGVLTRLLTTVVSRRHGATIVMSPGNAKLHLTEKNSVVLELGSQFGAYLESMARLHHVQNKIGETPAFDLYQADREAHSNLMRLQKACDAAAGLANLDGCLVIARDLSVTGFNETIEATGEVKPLLADFYTCDADKAVEFELSSKGHRHKSAARLCGALPGTIVFVVSQDGDLRVLSSAEDEEHVWAFENLATSTEMYV